MELKEVKSLIEEQNRLFTEFRQKNDAEIAEIKKFGTVLPETKASLDAMQARFDEIETKMARFKVKPGTDRDPAEKSVALKATEKWLRFGLKGDAAIDQMDAEEKSAFKDMRQKSISAQSDAGGGIFVPEDFQTDVIKKVANVVGVATMVDSRTTARDSIKWPKINYSTDDIDNSPLAMTWEDTNDAATPTDLGTSLLPTTIQTKKSRGLILVDRELLEDAIIDVTDLVTGLVADKIAVDKDRQCTIGPGGKKPEGFMTNGDISTVNSGASGLFVFDGLIDLVHNLPEQYAMGAQFMTKRLSMGSIRKLKDGEGRYIWEPSTQVGVPATLLGYPIRANEHIAPAAAAAKAMIFADFKRLYMIANKIGLSIQRLDEKYADADQVGFIVRVRWGGAVIAPWAARIQVLS